MTTKHTRRSVERLARRHSATVTVERCGSIVSVLVDAPDGYEWIPDGVTAMREDIRGRVSGVDWQYIAARIEASEVRPIDSSDDD